MVEFGVLVPIPTFPLEYEIAELPTVHGPFPPQLPKSDVPSVHVTFAGNVAGALIVMQCRVACRSHS
jgi:hypothetical protein